MAAPFHLSLQLCREQLQRPPLQITFDKDIMAYHAVRQHERHTHLPDAAAHQQADSQRLLPSTAS